MDARLEKETLFEAIYQTFGRVVPMDASPGAPLENRWIAYKGELTPFALYVTRTLGVDILFGNTLTRTNFFLQLFSELRSALGSQPYVQVGSVEWTLWSDGTIAATEVEADPVMAKYFQWGDARAEAF